MKGCSMHELMDSIQMWIRILLLVLCLSKGVHWWSQGTK